jgi:hypothetical protein
MVSHGLGLSVQVTGYEMARERWRHLLVLHSCLGLCEAVDEDGEDDVHHDEARQKGPRDEIGSDANLITVIITLVSDSQSLLISSLRNHFHTQIPSVGACNDSYSIIIGIL